MTQKKSCRRKPKPQPRKKPSRARAIVVPDPGPPRTATRAKAGELRWGHKLNFFRLLLDRTIELRDKDTETAFWKRLNEVAREKIR